MSATKRDIPSDVLAERYASPAMSAIWSARGKVVSERQYWIAVMQAQRELGLDIPAAAIAAYERVKDNVDLDSIRARERVTRHDVKARIEEFCALAGHEMTKPDDAQTQEWRKASAPLTASWAEATKKAGVNAEAAMAEFREAMHKAGADR